MSKELDSVELARIEFEKHLEEDPNNEWLKRLIKGLKMAEQALQRLEQIDNAKKDINSLYSNMHQTSDELDKSLKDSLFKNAKIEAIDNSKPSEALKSLEELRDYLLRDRINISSTKNYNIIEQALTTKSKKEQAFDVLSKYKDLNLGLLSDYEYYDYDLYYEDTEGTTDFIDNEDDFRTLKEWQDND